MQNSDHNLSVPTTKRSGVDIRLAAISRWLDCAPHSNEHPVLRFATKRFFFDEGINCDRVTFAAHGVLEDMPDTPVFTNPVIEWSRVKSPDVLEIAQHIALCVPTLPYSLSPTLDLRYQTPTLPTLAQLAAIKVLNSGGAGQVTAWLIKQQCLFVEYMHTAVLSIALNEGDERWPVLYLTDPCVFASEMADTLRSAITP